MVKGYQEVLCTVVSFKVGLLPQAYPLGALPLFSYNKSFPRCIKEGTITKTYQLLTYFPRITDIPWCHGIFNAFSLSLVCVQKPFCNVFM